MEIQNILPSFGRCVKIYFWKLYPIIVFFTAAHNGVMQCLGQGAGSREQGAAAKKTKPIGKFPVNLDS